MLDRTSIARRRVEIPHTRRADRATGGYGSRSGTRPGSASVAYQAASGSCCLSVAGCYLSCTRVYRLTLDVVTSSVGLHNVLHRVLGCYGPGSRSQSAAIAIKRNSICTCSCGTCRVQLALSAAKEFKYGYAGRGTGDGHAADAVKRTTWLLPLDASSACPQRVPQILADLFH